MQIHTVGHSNHSLDDFVALLEQYDIQQVVDVRSQPYSRRLPHFNRDVLSAALADRGLCYVHLPELGGRPAKAVLSEQDGECRDDQFGEGEVFRSGLERLTVLATERATAIMCAEGDYRRCHRHSLIEPALRRRGVSVLHIQRDGSRTEAGDNAEQLRLL
jgi:uncharacterized protein (DUF488 family)